MSEFDWDDKDAVVIPEQEAVAVYENTTGDLVIRMQKDPYDSEDAVVVVRRANVRSFTSSMCAVAKSMGI